MTVDLRQVGKLTGRKERFWIGGKKEDLDVYRIPLQHLYFNIENGRYADRMLRLKQENKGQQIDPRNPKWATEIEKMLAGEHRETAQDKAAFEKLKKDITEREQLRPGVCKFDGGVIDGNRRFAVLRRLNGKQSRTGKFGYFDAVILPKDTSHADLWRIEAGLQLGQDERWDYSPINELLKVREGIALYTKLINSGKLKGTPVQHVATSIYGRTEAQIEEMVDRLRLIDDYLLFVGKKSQYDEVGRTSERFLEANRIVGAAKNHQYDQKKLAKLRAVLFYVIHTDRMNNWELRKVYDAMGGDPKRRGRKPQSNTKALDDFLSRFAEPRELRDLLSGKKGERSGKAKQKATQRKKATKKAVKKPEHATEHETTDAADADVAVDNFLQTMESTKKAKAPRQLAENARVPLKTLVDSLGKKEVRLHLEGDFAEREALLEALEDIGCLHRECTQLVQARGHVAKKQVKKKARPKKSTVRGKKR